MNVAFEQRIDEIDWAAYSTAYGPADMVPIQLKQLASDDHAISMSASHELWAGLCHQHAYISSAAPLAFPFILEVFETANEDLSVEILDILDGFAVCSIPNAIKGLTEEWEEQIRHLLIEQLPRFQGLAQHKNEWIAEFAQHIIESLTKTVT